MNVSLRTAPSRKPATIAVLLILGLIPASPPGAAEATGASVAKIASAQNRVESRTKGTEAWSPSALNQALYGGDRVRTGPASRAAILYSDQTLHRLNEKSEIEILPPSTGNPGLLRVLSGQHYFSSRTPRDYRRIETSTVTAAIKGTEFQVEVAADSTTTITMLEGVVLASNSQGSVEVGQGEQAVAEPGKAPVKRVLVHPRDAVTWALYYPAVLGGKDAERLQALGADGESLSKAAQLLASGNVEAAKPLIESQMKSRPEDPLALSLASVIAVTEDRKDEGKRLADAAVAAGPDSAAAALAASFAAQSTFDIERAAMMAEKASQLDKESSVAMARAAEMRLAQGDVEAARRAAEEAVKRSPGEARALAVLGFVELAEFNSRKAEGYFQQAVSADSELPLAHLGLGICLIRLKKVQEGREQIQTASLLDPSDSTLRSYLGKAYYEERRSPEAAKELAAAKDLDPNDPTPYLYDAIVKQNENRPVEGLSDLQESIDRNDRRAVYRSRLLLDQDRAVRGSDLARIYNDLGFEQLGMVAARRSADEDHSNYSSHLTLAGSYRNVPNFAPAFLSEVLQARIYQPANVSAVRPDLVNQSVSFNEYTALFDRPRARGFADLAYGRTDTDLSQLAPDNPSALDPITLDDSRLYNGEVTGTLNGDHYAAALSYRKFEDDGYRVNSDQKNANYRGFFEYSPGYRDSFQLNAIVGRRETGDLPIRQLLTVVTPERLQTDLTNLGFGYHHIFSPKSGLAVSAIYNETEQSGENFAFLTEATATLRGPQLEFQQNYRTARTSWLFGAGGFDGTVKLTSPGSPDVEGDDEFQNGYVYFKLRGRGPLEVAAGASVEHVETPVGLFPPRDSNIAVTDLSFSETKVNPKLGVSAYLKAGTTLRAAGYYRLSPAIGQLQTLEPTQVAGFNQFFEERGGTHSLSYGAGVDQRFGRHIYGGVSFLRRELKIPEAYCSFEDPFSGCASFGGFPPADIIVERESTDDYGTLYLNATFGRRVAGSVEYTTEERDFDFTHVNAFGLFQDHIETRRLRPQVRVFFPSGLFAAVLGTRYDQEVDQFDDLTSSVRTTQEADFWIADAQVGYRFPKRYGTVALEARNLTDREFEFFERSIQDTVLPARTITLRVKLTY